MATAHPSDETYPRSVLHAAVDVTAPATDEKVADALAIDNRTYRRIGWRILPLLFLCYIINYIDRVNIGIAQFQFKTDLHFSDLVYGVGAGLFFVGFLLFEIPSNVMLARMGARRTLLRIMVGWGIVSCATMFVRTPMQFYAARILLGIAEAGFFPGIVLYLSYWFPAAHRARVTALSFTAIPVATMIGAPLSGWIMRHFDTTGGMAGWQWMFLLEGAPAVVLGVIAFFWLEDRPDSANWLAPQEKARLVETLAQEQASRRAALSDNGRGALAALRDPRVYVAAFVSFCAYILASTIGFYAPSVIRSAGVSDVFHVGLLAGVPAVVGIVAMIVNSRHSDRHAERRWHAALPLMVAALALMALPYSAGDVPLALGLLALATAGHLSSLSVFWTIPSAYLASRSAAAGIAFISSIGALGGLVGPSMIGYFKNLTGSMIGLQFAGGMVMIGAIALLIGLPKRVLASR